MYRQKAAENLCFRLSSPATESLTLLRAPIRGFASAPTPVLMLLVLLPVTAQRSGRKFLYSKQQEANYHSERSEESVFAAIQILRRCHRMTLG